MSAGNGDQRDGSAGGGRSRRQRRRERRHEVAQVNRSANRRQRAIRIGVGAVVFTGLAIGLILFVINTSRILPPTAAGPAHSEQFPSSQINSLPIPRPIQEHVMERNATHRDGSMLIQYNCVRFECELGLIAGLRDIVSVRPANVYLAPYPAMDAKIALAAPGRLVTMDEFDEVRINAFIDENLRR